MDSLIILMCNLALWYTLMPKKDHDYLPTRESSPPSSPQKSPFGQGSLVRGQLLNDVDHAVRGFLDINATSKAGESGFDEAGLKCKRCDGNVVALEVENQCLHLLIGCSFCHTVSNDFSVVIGSLFAQVSINQERVVKKRDWQSYLRCFQIWT